MEKEISHLLIDKTSSLIKALQKMDEAGRKLLIVTEKGSYYSLLSIGDIQRAILRENDLNIPVEKALRPKVRVYYETDDIETIKNHIRQNRNEFMPVLNKDGEISNVVFWEDVFEEEDRLKVKKFDLPVVIMAGGKGSRMKPLTNVLPKPLVPMGEKTILEHIMDSFLKFGSNRFLVSLNYKAEMIEHYLQSLKNPAYNIEFFRETQPLGTSGSLSLIRNKIKETFFVSNCDILIDDDYNEILRYHKENNNVITVVAAIKHYPIPYGILHTAENGLLNKLEEKPGLSFKINTGFYILEPEVLQHIPDNSYFNITDLINKLKDKNKRVGVFPVSEKSWTDIGTWNEYLNRHVKL